MEELKSYISQRGELISVPKGKILYRGGEIPEYAYLIVKGLVKVYDRDRTGREFIYAVLNRDTLFLGGSAVLQRPKTYSYQALTKLTVYRVSHAQIRALTWIDLDVLHKIMFYSAETHSKLASYVRSYSMQSPAQRVASLLLAYNAESGVVENGAYRITERINFRDMGPLIDASTATVSRAFSELCDQGLTRYIDGHYWIYDLDRLSELANCDDRVE